MSPVDGMGEFISQRQNMMFESTSKSEYEPLGSRISSAFGSSAHDHAMSRTLNGTYQTQSYGLGNANTTYPISAFLTHLVYLKGTSVQVDVGRVTGFGVRCVEIAGTDGHTTSFNAELVERAITEILAEV
ncbi:hypothetical protein C0991_010821 [Blastosporella zonata]|nr:hypothetical protein C0991_010821 [Blastosporella zonata]